MLFGIITKFVVILNFISVIIGVIFYLFSFLSAVNISILNNFLLNIAFYVYNKTGCYQKRARFNSSRCFSVFLKSFPIFIDNDAKVLLQKSLKQYYYIAPV